MHPVVINRVHMMEKINLWAGTDLAHDCRFEQFCHRDYEFSTPSFGFDLPREQNQQHLFWSQTTRWLVRNSRDEPPTPHFENRGQHDGYWNFVST